MFAGVDGCKGGWVVAKAREWPPSETPSLTICPTFESVTAFTAECVKVVVDMPIGLPEDRSGRECDAMARKMLGGRAASRVFPCPPRQAIQETTYAAFLQTHKSVATKGASKQSFAISPKIREIDEHITPASQARICEFHPELVWFRYAGEALISKHDYEGVSRRVEVLKNCGFVWFDECRLWRTRGAAIVAIDDLLDALAGLELASRIPLRAETVPPNPPTDPRGLRMEMWY